MTHQWEVSFDDGGSWTAVTPLNDGKLRIQRKRDLDAGQIFFRKYINQSILFGKGDYPQFLAIERQPSRRCNAILVRLQLKCANNYQEYWRGKFSTGSGTFNLSECTFEVKPDTVDKYSCILESQNKEVNVLLGVNINSVVYKPSCLEFGANVVTFEFGGGCTTNTNYPSDVQTDPSWTLIHTDSAISPFLITKIYWREVAITDCVSGSPISPNGSGWTLLENNCGTDGTAKWWRTPTAAWAYGDTYSSSATCPDSVKVTLVTQHYESNTCSGSTLIPNIYICVPGYVNCEATDPVTYGRARRLEDVLNKLLSESGCSATVKSDFFEWDPPGDTDGYVAGTNYVTGQVNQVDLLSILQNTDAAHPTFTNGARVGNTSINKVLSMIAVCFRAFWDVDADGNMRIEHIKHWLASADTYTPSDMNEPLLYSHLSGSIPSRERMKETNSFLEDFIGVDIVYSGPCASNSDDTVKETDSGNFSMDLFNFQTSPDTISKDGFVLLAGELIGDVEYVINDNGAFTTLLVPNAPLSTANLQRDYWTWDRFLPNGNMNGQDVTFDGFIPNIEQKGVSFPSCCDELAFDATKGITTTLGHLLGDIPAMVEEYEFDPNTGRATMTLRYSY